MDLLLTSSIISGMIGVILLGFLLGMIASAIDRVFSTKEMFGFMMLATVGVLEGKFLSSFIFTEHDIHNNNFAPLVIIASAMVLIGIKKLALFFAHRRERSISSIDPHVMTLTP